MISPCGDCGGDLPAAARFCPHCGVHLVADQLPRPGERIGRYVVKRRVGRGGMAAVYEAVDTELGRPVALKILTAAEFDADEAVARFRREAQITSRFNHPNAVTVYDYLVTDDGYPCLVLELVVGLSVRDALVAGPFTPERAARITADLLSVLAEAETLGLVHRDITADNILLVGGQHGERAKLLDFGIAKSTSPMGPGPLTIAGQIVGSPAYMAPEQCRGEKLDTRSDLYSLGVVLYEMLTGSLPFDGDNYIDVLRRQINDSPPPLPAHLPAGLERIVARALAKDPGARFPSPAAFDDALRRVVPLEAAREGTARPTTAACFLEPVDGSAAIPLEGVMVLGRDDNVDLLATGEGAELVSAMHAQIEVVGRRELRVRDLGSTNGTFVNRRRVQTAALHDGSILQLAASGPAYRVRIPASPDIGQERPGPPAAGRADRLLPRVAAWFRGWLSLALF